MSALIDILIVIFIILGVFAGIKRGLIKSLVSFIGLVAIVIISYSLRYYVAEFLIDKMPFFNYLGFEGLTSLNILIYNVLAFIFIFVILYCILNVVIAVTGFVDTLLKFTVIWIIPSKIGGAIVGFLETWVYLFILLFILSAFNITSSWVLNSKVANIILDHTPVIGNYLYGVVNGSKDIYRGIEEYRNENRTTEQINLYILQIEISHGLITKAKAQELIDTGKLQVGDVQFGKEDGLWLNI